MRKINIAFLMLLLIAVIASCSKSDEYKKYLEGGETFYTGKLDSVKIYSGRNRVKITGLLPADPKITRCRITWNDGKDSAVYPISKGMGIDSFSQIINVPEGVVSFAIRTFDAVGNGSLVVNAVGTAYGTKYENGLVNRPILSVELPATGNGRVVWGALDTTSGVIGTLMTYTKANNTLDSVFTSIRQSTTTLTTPRAGTSLIYKAVYKPTLTAIDSFYSSTNTVTDITSMYLSNVGPAFQSATLSGRFGTLAAPWVTNAAAKNKGGTNGGFIADVGGVIGWETWGNTPVTNGIIYQATSTALPAGRYVLLFDEYSEIQTNSSVYCVAAAGANGIPILSNLSTALGSVALYNGAAVGATSPSLSDTRSFTFTLATPQIVSIGFLGNIAGATTNGGYFQVKRIQLLKN